MGRVVPSSSATRARAERCWGLRHGRATRSIAVAAAVALATVVGVDPLGPQPGTGRWADAADQRVDDAAALTDAVGRTYSVVAGVGPGGDGSPAAPFATVAEALAVAGPGDTVAVAPGRYPGKLRTVRSGRADAPIRLVGTGGAHLYSNDQGRLLEVLHDHITIEGFELSNANIVVLISGARGVRLENNWIHGAYSECVRLRAFASDNTLFRNVIRECGLAYDGANGEAIYIGTAPEKLRDNPTPAPDASSRNLVWGNDIVVWGECVDIKEAADGNQVVENWCRGGSYLNGAGLSSRAKATVFINNWSTDHLGSGLQLAGDRPGNGSDSVVTGNVLTDNGQYGLKIVADATPQRQLCGNVLRGNRRAAATPAAQGADRPC